MSNKMDPEFAMDPEMISDGVNVAEPVAVAASVRPAIEVIAPVDMEGGYRFQVNTGGTRSRGTLQVEVPEGGVQAGQRFAAWVVGDFVGIDSLTPLPPRGGAALKWRDGFFECFKFGPCHPMCCLAFWCAPCALGQVMTRSKLNILGNPKTASSSSASTTFWTPFKLLFAMTALYIFIRGVTQTVIDYTVDDDDDNNNDDESYPAWASTIIFFRFLMFVGLAIFVLVLLIKTRRFLRHKDHIPAENCGKMEDCCVSFWCPWCTVCHLARHTADYNEFPARCCTDSGLPANTPLYG